MLISAESDGDGSVGGSLSGVNLDQFSDNLNIWLETDFWNLSLT